VPYRNTTIFSMNLKHHPSSELGALEVEFGPLPKGKPDYEGTADRKERNSTARSARKHNGADQEVRPLLEIQILHFLLLFFSIFFSNL
jgi:hypothetical protein